MADTKLTPTQIAALRVMADRPGYAPAGKGSASTTNSLCRLGLCTWGWKLTDAGHAVLRAA